MKEKQNCIQTLINIVKAQFVTRSRRWKVTPRVLHVEEDKYSKIKKTIQKKDLITRIARWALQLEEFDYEIEHRAGSRMKHVDALSRNPIMILYPVKTVSAESARKAKTTAEDLCSHQAIIRRLNEMVQIRRQITENIKQHYMLQYKIDTIRTISGKQIRNDAKKNIETLQSENRKTYNRRRKQASLYKEGDLVAIQRTQFAAELKPRPKFLGPYKVTKVNSKDRYEVEKVGQHEGPKSTATSADLMIHFYAFN
ncbi:uncharacterized protein TNCV_3309021 [Trichonephila clavipes]|nr:uncharacterized protein TNCV_3309021 [Trichonephila clavipes]